MAKENRDISVITGIFIENEKGEIWFGRMPKWRDTLGVVGGHVERGETLEASAIRELKEETGLDATFLEYIDRVEIIDPKEFIKKKHFVGFNFRHRVEGRPDIDFNDEFTEGMWLTIDDALDRDDLNALTILSLEQIKKGNICDSCEKYKYGWARAQADYQNLVRETEEKKKEYMTWSKQMILEDFIPVYDNFKKAFAMEHLPVGKAGGTRNKEQENWIKGIEYIMKQYGDILKNHGVVEMKTVGEKFDPAKHEAMQEEESDEEGETILRELDAGYMMGEKVVKAAKVVVSK